MCIVHEESKISDIKWPPDKVDWANVWEATGSLFCSCVFSVLNVSIADGRPDIYEWFSVEGVGVSRKRSAGCLCFPSTLIFLFPHHAVDVSHGRSLWSSVPGGRPSHPLSQIDASDDRRRSSASATHRFGMSSMSGPQPAPPPRLWREKQGLIGGSERRV